MERKEKEQLYSMLQERERRLSSKDCQHFIENYVQIEDRDVPGLAISFSLWPKQIETLLTFLAARLAIALKARQLGLTWLALAYAVWQMIFSPGYSVVALSKTEDDAKELARRVAFILRHLPGWIPKWDATTMTVTVYHVGEPSTFRSMTAAADSGRSFTASLVILDEWAFQQWARDIWSAAYPTVNRPTGGQVIGLSTGKRGTLFEEVWDAAVKGLNGFVAVFLPWRSDPRRTDEWYEQTKKAMPNSYRSEYPTNPADAFTVGQGAFFEEWDESVHVVGHWDPPKDWVIIGGYDAGFASNACFKWYAVSPDHWARCFKEYYPHRVTDPEQAKEIKRLSVYSDGTPFSFDYITADTDAWTPSRDSGKSTAETFADYGIDMSQATKDLENGWRRLHEWLEPFTGADGQLTALLTFSTDCQNSRRTYPSCECSKTNPEDIARDSEHHCQDVDRYFVMSRPEPGRPIPEEKPKKLLEKLGLKGEPGGWKTL
jgi:hypothetical protein